MTHAKHPLEVVFFKLGGTWDMVNAAGFIGSGVLDDAAIHSLETSVGFYKKSTSDYMKLEFSLAKKIQESIRDNNKQQFDIDKSLPWVPKVGEFVTGKFVSLYSGDSSLLRPALTAPLISHLLRFANDNPNLPILAAQGTDTADIAIIPFLDAYLFDTNLLPILVTGSNRSHTEWNSDAPKNFSDMIQLAGANLPSGCYWVFGSHVYRASDFLKIDPLETRRIENYSTFFAPRLTARYAKKVIEENHVFHLHPGHEAWQDHISQKTSMQSLFDAMQTVDTIDLGDQNPIDNDAERIMSKDTKAIVLAAHSLGNVSGPIKYACVEAVKNGKLVILVSRTLIGYVNERYGSSLLRINAEELSGTGKQLIAGHKMNKYICRAIVTRAVEEKLNQKETQELINAYCESRGLL